jgi:hypothetical protein
MIGRKNLSTSICPMTMAKLVQAPCIGSQCMAWRDFDGVTGFCGIAGQASMSQQIPANATQAQMLATLTGAADSTK